MNVIIVQMDVALRGDYLRVSSEPLHDGERQHFCPPRDPGLPEIVNY